MIDLELLNQMHAVAGKLIVLAGKAALDDHEDELAVYETAADSLLDAANLICMVSIHG